MSFLMQAAPDAALPNTVTTLAAWRMMHDEGE